MSSTAAPRGVATQLSSTGLIAVTWVGASLGILFTVARIAIRIKYMRCLLADDYFMLLALAFLIANAILQTLQTPHLYYMILQSTGPDFVDHVVRYTRFEFVIIVMFLPLSLIWGTRINSRQKIGLAIVFSFGFMIIATAIVRAVEITGKAYSDQAALAVWSIVESSICKWPPTLDPLKYTNDSKAIIVGCLPPFRSIISSGKSISQYRYGLSSGAPASNPISPNDKLRASTSNWGDASLTVQNQRGYQNMDLEMRPLNQGQVTRHSNYSNDTPRGPDLKIQMVQEFVSFPS
ncbi:hypothetical protein N7457_005980 [Penicillium paradoxum]|uniref:uncharacterized protein n=1 Tax=Penicillium paradoxum TaxID=176176 RepID=UPI0025468FE2|nr:uncharacterized protein N7457_005980 [Penicillium paradoxum]KAJ5780820.1 hypothetical protein N7457_005980 [Penicillium paradoxum]